MDRKALGIAFGFVLLHGPAAASTSADSAVLLAPEIVSTAAPEFAATVGPGGTLYFNRIMPERGKPAILSSG